MKKIWHDNAFLGLHFDLHAGKKDTGLGKNLTVEHLVKQLQKVKPDFVHCDCKGHPGYTSYPTKVGIPSPGIVKDMLRMWRDATRQLGLPLIMHYSGVWDTAAIEKNSGWARIKMVDGKPEKDTNNTCPLSGYTEEYMIPQLLEVIDTYDVDGFWVDGENWASFPCYCDRCTDLFRQQTSRTEIPMKKGNDGWHEWAEFGRRNFEEHVRKYANAVHARKPGCTVCSNWMYTMRQPDKINVPVDYLSGDFSFAWSCYTAVMEARIMDSREMGWDLMAWAFTSHRELSAIKQPYHWVFKTVPAICQEAGVVMSCGGAFMVYDTPNRSGNLIEWHMDELSEVADFCRKRQEFCQHTVSVPQIAVMHSKDHYYANNCPLYDFGLGVLQAEGALEALLDNNLHVDILTETTLLKKIKQYPMCVAAEQDNLSDSTIEALKKYVFEGGALLVSGADQTKRFDGILGVRDADRYAGDDCSDSVNIPVGKRTVCGGGKWRMVKNENAYEIAPVYFSRDIGEYVKKSGFPAATVRNYGKGVIAGIYGPIFGTYSYSHYPLVRAFIGQIIDSMKVEKLMRVKAPARINVSLRKKDNRLFINLVNRSTDNPLSPDSPVVENVPPVVEPMSISMYMPEAPKAVYMALNSEILPYEYKDNRLNIKINKVDIYDIIAIEH